MQRTSFSRRDVEAAVAISADLHSHPHFERFRERHGRRDGAIEIWRVCIDAATLLEDSADEATAAWGETHDFYLAIEGLVGTLVQQEDLDLASAVRTALAAASYAGHSTQATADR